MDELTSFQSIQQHLLDAKAKVLAPAKKLYDEYKVKQDREAQARKDLEIKARAIESLFNKPEFKVFQEFSLELEHEMARYWMRGGEKDYSGAAWLLNELRERPANIVNLYKELKENTEG